MPEKLPVDYAATKDEAWALAGEYLAVMRASGDYSGWLIGVDPDPVPGPDGNHGYMVYAVRDVPEPRQPMDDDEYRELGGEG